MASTLTVPTKGKNKEKGKNMATSNVVPQTQADPTRYVGKVTKKVDNPFTGKKVEMVGEYNVPLAQNFNEINSMVKGDENEVVFWFNFGRKVAARSQVNQALDFSFDDEKLDDQYSSFNNALKNMVDDDTSEEDRRTAINFILGQKKFADLKVKLADLKFDAINVDFSETEIRKPSGIRGRRKKEDSEEDSAE